MEQMDQMPGEGGEARRLPEWMYSPAAVAAGQVAGQLLKLCLVAGFTIGTYKVFFEPRVVAVDLNKVIREELQRAGERGQTDTERALHADRFGQALEAALTEAADGGRNIVLVAPAVMRGAEDQTEAVQAAVKTAMEQKHVAGR